jgi:hypothetical protein
MLRTFPEFLDPGLIVRRLVPRDSIWETIFDCAHSPTARSTTTENTPMIIPRLESHDLSLFAIIFFIEDAAVLKMFIEK